ncbi:folylpolyglutamate synthase, mitochondrial-like [Actinia tenebrosa]|uniref:Folylpolyglutamate synthase n=1 Tax=Actinia tenebrosa TaxID=6105 RepID=A0A6P8ITG2_ACTTE|nr:folylpolyglutamate synthase, mitochondrial-like [Actinia tenebrosa]
MLRAARFRNFPASLRSCSNVSFARAVMENRTYEDAVKALNTLQTNAQVLQQIRKTRGRLMQDNLEEMRTFTKRAGVTMERLDQLSVIHVSGTKGKGSTCAFSESILQSSGYKTGFYSSPHLIEVRERIRINGKALSKDLFTKYFFDCWDNLQETKESHDGKMPAYFRFLTLMSFYVFLEEKVDVAIVEVGIGGAYDSTNILRKPVVCGVTSLGMDHVETLGGSLESIAWQKAGIFKPGVPAFTVEQEESALQTVYKRAKEVKIPLYLVPKLKDYPGDLPELSLAGEHQHTNASMALQLCKTWLHKRMEENQSKDSLKSATDLDIDDYEPDRKKLKSGIPVASTFEITGNLRKGLVSARWNGRCQKIVRPNITFYLDGAHTPKSVEACAKWFKQTAEQEAKDTDGKVARVLLFNLTGDRDPHGLLRPLVNLKFDHVVFSPNTVNIEMIDNSDLANFTVTRDSQLRWCVENQRVWMALRGAGYQAHPIASLDDDHLIQNGQDDGPYSTIFPCVAQAIRWITAGRDPLITPIQNNDLEHPESIAKASRIQLLITGSLHLVGTAMKVLGTEITGEM